MANRFQQIIKPTSFEGTRYFQPNFEALSRALQGQQQRLDVGRELAEKSFNVIPVRKDLDARSRILDEQRQSISNVSSMFKNRGLDAGNAALDSFMRNTRRLFSEGGNAYELATNAQRYQQYNQRVDDLYDKGFFSDPGKAERLKQESLLKFGGTLGDAGANIFDGIDPVADVNLFEVADKAMQDFVAAPFTFKDANGNETLVHWEKRYNGYFDVTTGKQISPLLIRRAVEQRLMETDVDAYLDQENLLYNADQDTMRENVINSMIAKYGSPQLNHSHKIDHRWLENIKHGNRMKEQLYEWQLNNPTPTISINDVGVDYGQSFATSRESAKDKLATYTQNWTSGIDKLQDDARFNARYQALAKAIRDAKSEEIIKAGGDPNTKENQELLREITTLDPEFLKTYGGNFQFTTDKDIYDDQGNLLAAKGTDIDLSTFADDIASVTSNYDAMNLEQRRLDNALAQAEQDLQLNEKELLDQYKSLDEYKALPQVLKDLMEWGPDGKPIIGVKLDQGTETPFTTAGPIKGKRKVFLRGVEIKSPENIKKLDAFRNAVGFKPDENLEALYKRQNSYLNIPFRANTEFVRDPNIVSNAEAEIIVNKFTDPNEMMDNIMRSNLSDKDKEIYREAYKRWYDTPTAERGMLTNPNMEILHSQRPTPDGQILFRLPHGLRDDDGNPLPPLYIGSNNFKSSGITEFTTDETFKTAAQIQNVLSSAAIGNNIPIPGIPGAVMRRTGKLVKNADGTEDIAFDNNEITYFNPLTGRFQTSDLQTGANNIAQLKSVYDKMAKADALGPLTGGRSIDKEFFNRSLAPAIRQAVKNKQNPTKAAYELQKLGLSLTQANIFLEPYGMQLTEEDFRSNTLK